MPKDITHWVISEKIFDALGKCDLKRIISDYKHLYYIGAISYDIPFYRFGRKDNCFGKVADKLHELEEGSSLQPLVNILNAYKNSIPDYVLAFAAGAITHVKADSNFHPMVYYFTGNYYEDDSAVVKHREFESKLDLYYKSKYVLDNKGIARNSFKNKKISHEELINLLLLMYSGHEGVTRQDISKALCRYSLIQHAFSSKPLYSALKGLNKLSGSKYSKELASFYPPEKEVNFDFFKGQLEYQNPCMTELVKESVDDITNRTVKQAVSIFRKIGDYKDTNDLIKIIENEEGPSLDTGLTNFKVKDMKYFNTTYLFDGRL